MAGGESSIMSLAQQGAAASLLAPSHRCGALLPRELVLWIQSMQLDFPIRYPRRDLANGYLIAQICSRYWSQVPMHSLTNSVGLQRRRSNWTVLRRVLTLHGVAVSAAMVEGIIQCEDKCAELFLHQLYPILTGNVVQVDPTPMELPPVVDLGTAPYVPPRGGGSRGGDARGPDLTAGFPLSVPLHHSQAGGSEAPQDGLRAPGDSVSPIAGMPNSPATTAAGAVSRGLPDGGSELPHQLSSGAPPTPTTSRRLSVPIQLNRSGTTGASSARPMLAVAVRTAGHIATVQPAGGDAVGQWAMQDAAGTATALDHAGGTGAGGKGALLWFTQVVCHAAPELSRLQSSSSSSADKGHEGVVERDAAAAMLVELSVPQLLEGVAKLSLAAQAAVWAALQNHVGELVVLSDGGGHGLPMLLEHLLEAAQQSRSSAAAVASGGVAGPSSFASIFRFLSSFFMQLSDQDAHRAFALFQNYFLTSQLFMRGLVEWWCTTDVVESYAELFCLALPLDQQLAAQYLSPLLDALFHGLVDTVAAAGEVEETALAQFLHFLRSLLSRLAWRTKAIASASLRSGTPPSSSALGRSPGGRITGRGRAVESLVASTLHRLCLRYVEMSLYRCDTAALYLAGVALAVDLLDAGLSLTGKTVMSLATTTTAAVSATSAATGTSVTLLRLHHRIIPQAGVSVFAERAVEGVMRARWLRVMAEHGVLLIPTSPAAGIPVPPSSNSPLPQHGRPSEWVNNSGPLTHQLSPEAEALLTAIHDLCLYLCSPGGPTRAKVCMAYHLANTLPYLPSQYKTAEAAAVYPSCAEEAAEAVMHVLACRATEQQVRRVLLPASAFTASVGAAERTGRHAEDGASANTAWPHAMLGDLMPMGGLMAGSSPLLLAKAVLCVLEKAKEDVKDATRRLMARATIIARDGFVELLIQRRIEWMYNVVVRGRRANNYQPPLLLVSPNRPHEANRRSTVSTASTAAMTEEAEQWQVILENCYTDVVVVLLSAGQRLRQRSAAVRRSDKTASVVEEAIGLPLLSLAQKAEELVCDWKRELGSVVEVAPDAQQQSTSMIDGKDGEAGRGGTSASRALVSSLISLAEPSNQTALEDAVVWFSTVAGPDMPV